MNARRARERNTAERDKLRRLLREAEASQPRYLMTLPGGLAEMWTRGPVMFVLPALVDAYPEPVKAAVDRRRRATLEGVCDCGARHEVTRRGGIEMAHEDGCVASDRVIRDLGAEHGVTFARWAA